MSPVGIGIVSGLAVGVADVLLMLPMEFPDTRTALTAAFLSRFAIGFLVPLVKMPLPPWAVGALVGLLVSTPGAIITRP